MPQTLPRLVPVWPPERSAAERTRRASIHFVWLEQLVAAHLDTLFPGMEVLAAHPFRVTRDAEVAIQELEADDLLETIEEGVRRRRFGSGRARDRRHRRMPDFMRDILIENLEARPGGHRRARAAARREQPHGALRRRPARPQGPAVRARRCRRLSSDEEHATCSRPSASATSCCTTPTTRSSRSSTCSSRRRSDPDVLAIKKTLYRVGRNTPVVEALLEAAAERQAGRRARRAQGALRRGEQHRAGRGRSSSEGVHVVYGLLGLKTHSKIALIVRREGDGIRRYLHLGTGNYNVVTAHAVHRPRPAHLPTSRWARTPRELFNFLTGYATRDDYETLPGRARRPCARARGAHRREIEHARAGRGGHMIFKMNSLVDQKMIRLLYEASQAGVQDRSARPRHLLPAPGRARA